MQGGLETCLLGIPNDAPTCVKLVNLVCNESDSIETVKNTDSELASFTSENVTLADILWCMLM